MPGMLAQSNPDDTMLDGSPASSATPDDPAKSMYHDYLTNPNSTYAQDPTLSGDLKAATADGVQPGTLSGTPQAVAQQGLKPEAYSKLYSPEVVNGMLQTEYANDLGRAADAPGMEYWNKKISEGLTPDQAATFIRNSPEAKAYAASKQGPAAPMPPTVAPIAIPTQGYTATPATASTAGSHGYTAAQTQVTPGMLASGNLTQIMDPNSPIMVQARTRGDQLSTSRGLLNSSIGISAAEDSAYRAAIPIAQQDANTQAQIGQANTSATNQASQFTAGAANDAEKLNAQLLTGVSQSNAASSNAALQFNAGSANTAALTGAQLASQQTIAQLSADTQRYVANLNSQTQASLADVNNKHGTLLQTSTQAATMMNNFASTVANIQASTTMGADAKQLAVDTQLTNLRNGLQALEEISGLDLAKYFPTTQAATPPATPPTSTVEDRGYP